MDIEIPAIFRHILSILKMLGVVLVVPFFHVSASLERFVEASAFVVDVPVFAVDEKIFVAGPGVCYGGYGGGFAGRGSAGARVTRRRVARFCWLVSRFLVAGCAAGGRGGRADAGA